MSTSSNSTTFFAETAVTLLVLLSVTETVSGRVLVGMASAGQNRQECQAFNVSAVTPNRNWGQDKCSEDDIVIDQGPSAPLPNGIPTYSVSILNACSSGCEIGKIHVKCGKFASARLINPDVFKRLDYDDCLVYGGRPIPNGMTISFEYANTYKYPMDVIQYECCPVNAPRCSRKIKAIF